MNLIKAKLQYYRSLGTLENAGVRPAKALRQSHPAPLSRAARQMAEAIEQGEGDIGGLMARYPRLFSGFECQLVTVGQHTGRLDVVYGALAEWFELLFRLRGQIISRMVYPLLLYHVAALLIPLVSALLAEGSLSGAVLQSGLMMAAPWLVYFLFRVGAGLLPRTTATIDAAILCIPLLGTLSRRLSYARFFRALGLALDAGVGYAAAVQLAAQTCSNVALARGFRGMATEIETGGCSFVEVLRRSLGAAEENALAVTLLETGEESGTVAEMATRLARIYWEEAEQTLNRIATVVPTLVYLGLVLYLAGTVLRFWQQLMSKTTELAF